MENTKLPFLAHFDEDGTPVFPATRAEYKSDLKPMFKDIADIFGKVDVGSYKNKVRCHKECTKPCGQEAAKRENELVTVGHQNERTSLEPIVQMIQNREATDTQVLVEDSVLFCNGLVLSTYSKYIQSLASCSIIDLRNKPVPKNIFIEIYKWMIASKEKPESVDIVELVRAVFHLEVTKLIEVCLKQMDGDTFQELSAFDIMLRCQNHPEMAFISMAMLSRISTSLLIIMSTPQFLTLNKMELCALISLNSIAVNSETELFFGVLRWLDVDWPKRSNCVSAVLRMIRFGFLPIPVLTTLTGQTQMYLGPFDHIIEEFCTSPVNKRLLRDGICNSTLVILSNTHPKEMEKVTGNKELMIPRRWIKDSRCIYHRPVTKLCPNMTFLNYDAFVAYSEILQKSEINYEHYITYAKRDDEDDEWNMSEHKVHLSTSMETHIQDFIKQSVNLENLTLDNLSLSSTSSYQTLFDTISPSSLDNYLSSSDTLSIRTLTAEQDESDEQGASNWHSFVENCTPSKIWQEWERTVLRGPPKNSPDK